MPGTSPEIRLLNFALFRRGELDEQDVDAGQGLNMRVDRKWQHVKARKGLARRQEKARERAAEGDDPLADVKHRARQWASETTGRVFDPLPKARDEAEDRKVPLRAEGVGPTSNRRSQGLPRAQRKPKPKRKLKGGKAGNPGQPPELKMLRAAKFRVLVEELNRECLARGVSRKAVLDTVGVPCARLCPNQIDGSIAISDCTFARISEGLDRLRAGRISTVGRRRSKLGEVSQRKGARA
jgi:hypothetical protein